MQLLFCSSNVNKTKEIQHKVGVSIQIKNLLDLGFTGEIPENANTFEGNALLKAQFGFDKFGTACFSDDSGLEVEALNKEPGVYSARYAGEPKSDERNMEKLLLNLKGIQSRKACFKTVLIYIDAHGKKHIFEGRYIRASDGINNRDYSSLIVGYTLKLGHPTKSVLSILDSKKVEGVIFEDLNLNGVQDNNEKGIKGIKVIVESDKGDRKTDETDSDGDFKISGLNEEVYYFSTEGNSSYTLANHPGALNFKMQEGYQVKLPAVKTKNIEVSISGESEEGVYVSVDCKEKEGLNKIPMQVGVKAFIAVPVKNDCILAVNVLGTNENISVFPELIQTKDLLNNQANFEVKSSKILLGQVFYDKNKNGYYEFGEELTNVEVVFDKYNMKTDENGIFTTKVKSKDNKVKFLKVKGYKCNLRNPEIEDFSGKKLITISCQK